MNPTRDESLGQGVPFLLRPFQGRESWPILYRGRRPRLKARNKVENLFRPFRAMTSWQDVIQGRCPWLLNVTPSA